MPHPTCEQCGYAVTFGPTEHGYRGFTHDATGTTDCPPSPLALYPNGRAEVTY